MQTHNNTISNEAIQIELHPNIKMKDEFFTVPHYINSYWPISPTMALTGQYMCTAAYLSPTNSITPPHFNMEATFSSKNI
jgi:hypothetical protein